MLTSENIGLTNIENPIRPGMRKSMYFVCSMLTVVWETPMMLVPLNRCRLNWLDTPWTV